MESVAYKHGVYLSFVRREQAGGEKLLEAGSMDGSGHRFVVATL
jgi:hypothetical protein